MKPVIGINDNGDDEDDTKIYFDFACIFTWFIDEDVPLHIHFRSLFYTCNLILLNDPSMQIDHLFADIFFLLWFKLNLLALYLLPHVAV